MKILHLSTNDFGGAGAAALRIHRAHLKAEDDSILLVKRKRVGGDGVFELKGGWVFKILRLFRVILRKILFSEEYLMYGSLPTLPGNICKELRGRGFVPDVVIVHWVSDFVDFKDILHVNNEYSSRLLFYFMDMANFTGGCHFSNSCEKYKSGCFKCPADRLKLSSGLPHYQISEKEKIAKCSDATPIAPNEYVAVQSNSSIVFSEPAKVAYIPIPETVFFPLHSSFVYKSKVTILFGSPDLSGGRKGGDLFISMLKKFDAIANKVPGLRFVEVLIPGLSYDYSFDFDNVSIKSCQYANSEEELALLYRGVDLFVCCSRQDSGPMMISEALMSGVPVLTFDVGIANELINNEENGFIVEMEDIDCMSERLAEICQLSEESFSRLRLASRNLALEKFSQDAFVSAIKAVL